MTTLKDKVAIVGIGTTKFWRRGGSGETTELELMCQATMNAVDDSGLSVDDIDGFSFYSGGYDAGLLSQTLGLPEVRYAVSMTGGGGGSQGTVTNAAAAIATGYADVVLCVKGLKQGGHGGRRIGHSRLRTENDLLGPFGLMSPGQTFALMARQHMEKYGTTTRQFGQVAVSTRFHASRNPAALVPDADHAGRPRELPDDLRAAATARLLPRDRRWDGGDRDLGRTGP